MGTAQLVDAHAPADAAPTLFDVYEAFKPRFDPAVGAADELRFSADTNYGLHDGMRVQNLTGYDCMPWTHRFFSRIRFGKRSQEPRVRSLAGLTMDARPLEVRLEQTYSAVGLVPERQPALLEYEPDNLHLLSSTSQVHEGDLDELLARFRNASTDFSVHPHSDVQVETRRRLERLTDVVRLQFRVADQVAGAPVSHFYENLLALTYDNNA